jgi:hypothetical protein
VTGGKENSVAPSAITGSTKSMLIFAPWRIGLRPRKLGTSSRSAVTVSRGVSPGRWPVGLCCPPYRFDMALEHPEAAERGHEDDHAQREKGHTL